MFAKIFIVPIIICLLPLSPTALATDSSPGATVYIISPTAGEALSSPFKVRFGLSGMGIAPAGIAVPGTGHHHLLIDTEELPDLTAPLGSSEQLKHFGQGQTEAELALPAGEHTLQLIFGDHLHIPHAPPVMSEKITITIE